MAVRDAVTSFSSIVTYLTGVTCRLQCACD